jgi:hypothetical protein
MGVRLPLNGTAAVQDHFVQDQVPNRDGGPGNGPVIVLTYPHAGGDQLSSLLARNPELACTAGTGILPMCEQAATAWSAVDGRPAGSPSRLAETSTRSLVTSMLTALLARQGKRRWCEVATAAPDAAATFARLFPGTRIVCLHRGCPDVVRAALNASPWGLAGPMYASFTSAHPASTAAALTAYWAAHTSSLLAFERAHPEICYRVRYEDLGADCLSGLSDFLGLEDPGYRPAAWLFEVTADPAHSATSPETGFPAGQVPPVLLERANDLMERLGYRPVRPTVASTGSS